MINAWAQPSRSSLSPSPIGRGRAEARLKSGQDEPSSGGGEEDSRYQQRGSCLPHPLPLVGEDEGRPVFIDNAHLLCGPIPLRGSPRPKSGARPQRAEEMLVVSLLRSRCPYAGRSRSAGPSPRAPERDRKGRSSIFRRKTRPRSAPTHNRGRSIPSAARSRSAGPSGDAPERYRKGPKRCLGVRLLRSKRPYAGRSRSAGPSPRAPERYRKGPKRCLGVRLLRSRRPYAGRSRSAGPSPRAPERLPHPHCFDVNEFADAVVGQFPSKTGRLGAPKR